MLDEAVIARAMAEAAAHGPFGRRDSDGEHRTGRRVDLAQALAAAFDYRFVGSDELLGLRADLRRAAAGGGHAPLLRGGAHADRLLAIFADPFDTALRGWLETADRRRRSSGRSLPGTNSRISSRAAPRRCAPSTPSCRRPRRRANSRARVDNLSYVSISEDASPVVRLVHSTVYDALRAGASDIHLESTATASSCATASTACWRTSPRSAASSVAEQVISRIKVMSELDIAERRVPQDGRFKIALDGRPIDFRVSIMPSIFGEDAVLRILDKQALTEQMQRPAARCARLRRRASSTQLRRLSSLPYGMLLVTGPTGSGKTTTLYAAISETQTGRDKIVTIEDPVEYQLPGVLQIPVNEKKGLTFARGLRSILRHDPDKIMVGEIRDPETAQIAIQSALTGHLVFTTVHANNVFDVVSRFTHMGVDTYSFVSALSACWRSG